MSDRKQPRTPRTSRPVESPFDAAALQADLAQTIDRVAKSVAEAVFLAATEPVVKTEAVTELVEPVVKTASDSKPQVNKGRRSSSPRPNAAVVAEAKGFVDDVVERLEAVKGLSGMPGWEGKLLRKKLPLKSGASFTVVNDHLRAVEAGRKHLQVCEDARDSRKQAAAKVAVKAAAKAAVKAAEAAKLSKDASALVERAAALTESQQRRVPQWVFLALRKPLAANAPANVVDSFVRGIALLEKACAEADAAAVKAAVEATEAADRTAKVRAKLDVLAAAAHPGKTESDHRPGGPWERAQRRAAEKKAANRQASRDSRGPGKK